jgi:hypothetical protein
MLNGHGRSDDFAPFLSTSAERPLVGSSKVKWLEGDGLPQTKEFDAE